MPNEFSQVTWSDEEKIKDRALCPLDSYLDEIFPLAVNLLIDKALAQ